MARPEKLKPPRALPGVATPIGPLRAACGHHLDSLGMAH